MSESGQSTTERDHSVPGGGHRASAERDHSVPGGGRSTSAPTSQPFQDAVQPPNRYARQERLSAIGAEGQRRISLGRIAIVGVGALGTVSADLLARAGVGSITLIDGDCVELTNLQRQVLYTEADARDGVPKASAAATHLSGINSDVQLRPVVRELTSDNARSLLADHDLIVDGTDNMDTRYLINEVACELSIPWIYGAATGTHGAVMTIVPGETACFSCYLPDPPESAGNGCATVGVLGMTTHLVASLQSTEAVRILTGNEPTKGLRLLDPWYGTHDVLGIERAPDCPVCVHGARPHLNRNARSRTAHLCGSGTYRIQPPGLVHVDLAGFSERLAPEDIVSRHAEALRFRAGAAQVTLFEDGRALVHGPAEPHEADRIYREYVGA